MRPVLGIFDAPAPRWVGNGFPVRTMVSHLDQGQHCSPFLLLDHAGPVSFDATRERRGVGVHPHKGFETVTIVYDGEVEHRDSTGAGGLIGPGDVQWMTAGAGILHEEYHSPSFAATGGTFEMVQMWVNLPAEHKLAKPGYQQILNADIPSVILPAEAGTVRVIAGAFTSQAGPARTFTPMNIWDVRLSHGKSTDLDIPDGHTLQVLVLSGSIAAGEAVNVRAGQTVLFDRGGDGISITAQSNAKLLVLSGAPINEPVVAKGPFVMNTEEEIRQAMRDFRNGRFGAIDGHQPA